MYKERKSLRLLNYDYSSEGAYFITICAKGKKPHLGKIIDSKIFLSDIGKIAEQCWLQIPEHFKHIRIDDFVVMPNHLHGILFIDYSLSGTRHGVSLQSPTSDIVGPCHGMALQRPGPTQIRKNNQFSIPVKGSISVIINQYKSSVTRWCNKNCFNYFQWQPRFYDNIIRNENALDSIRQYIKLNVRNWKDDNLFVG